MFDRTPRVGLCLQVVMEFVRRIYRIVTGTPPAVLVYVFKRCEG